MKKRHIFTLFTIFLLITGLVGSAIALPVSRPSVEAADAIVLADLNTGDIIFAQNEHNPIHPASTTKIMTALLAVEALERGDVNINDMVATSETALADMIEAGSAIGLEVGEEMTFEALLFASMLISANDATNVIAEHIAGSIDNFVQMMNDRARELGALNTTFRNPHGLTQDGHMTTAYDIFRISYFAVSLPRFADLYSMQERPFRATNERPAGIFTSTNRLTDPDADGYYPGASGVKTGFTQAAGMCLVSTATRDDISLLAVVMGVPTGIDGVNHFTETAALYDWAFENLTYTELLPATLEITRIPISLGDGRETIGLRPANAVNALVFEGMSLQDARQEVTLFYDDDNPLIAPVNQGDILGEITLHYGDRTFGPIPLVAAENVALSRTAYMRQELESTLGNIWVLVVIVVLVLLVLLYIVYAVNHAAKKRKKRRERMARK
ncbi:MAG: D-alanyl-D-alanine carboxypeptidase [Oscillospiraceae bacterium]|nr:D-alanyl-D-alanine carboxypeptidase [Oscillospiraceae bacterium]